MALCQNYHSNENVDDLKFFALWFLTNLRIACCLRKTTKARAKSTWHHPRYSNGFQKYHECSENSVSALIKEEINYILILVLISLDRYVSWCQNLGFHIGMLKKRIQYIYINGYSKSVFMFILIDLLSQIRWSYDLILDIIICKKFRWVKGHNTKIWWKILTIKMSIIW